MKKFESENRLESRFVLSLGFEEFGFV